MSRLLYLSNFLLASTLLIGSTTLGNSTLMWAAASSNEVMQIVRGLMVAAALLFLILGGLRSRSIRLFCALLSLATLSWAIDGMLFADLKIFDILFILSSFTIFGVAALDKKPAYDKATAKQPIVLGYMDYLLLSAQLLLSSGVRRVKSSLPDIVHTARA